MPKSTLAFIVLAAAASVPAQASLQQTLIISRSPTDLAVHATTPAERNMGLTYGAMAMTLEVARYIDSLAEGAIVQCNVTALKQASSGSSDVWSIFGIDSGSCKPLQQ